MSTKSSDRAKITEKAEHFVKSGKIEEAVAEYQKLLDGTGQDISIGNMIGDLCLQLGQEDKAIQLFLANVETLERRGAYSQALAIAKKVNKIRPTDPAGMVRLGDLYGQLGFSIEARNEYIRASDELEKRGETKPLIALYEKRARIDRSDLVTRLKLAKIYLEEGKGEQAQIVLNDAADLLYVRKEYGEAEKILLEAVAVGDSDIRTLTNLIRIYRELQRPEAAADLLERVLKKRGQRTDILSLLAGLQAEQGNYEKAAEIYAGILAVEPGNHDFRAKAGMVEIKLGRFDSALEIFDPLVSLFLQKSDEDKAVGLLGLILMSGRMHLPTLERLTGVFRGVGRTRDLEITLRVLLAEYRAVGRENDRIRILRELYIISPMDPEIIREAEKLGVKKEFRKSAMEKGSSGTSAASEEDREMIRMNLAKAELYLEQGLTKNARRILENLRLLYPDDPRVQKKFDELKNVPTMIEEQEIPEVVEETGRRESVIAKASHKPAVAGTPAAPAPSPPRVSPVSARPPDGLEEFVTDLVDFEPPASDSFVPEAPEQSVPEPMASEPEILEPPESLPVSERLVSEPELPEPSESSPISEPLVSETKIPEPPAPSRPVVKPPRSKKETPVFTVRGAATTPPIRPAVVPPGPAEKSAPLPQPVNSAQAEPRDLPFGPQVTAAELFAGLDLGPFVPPPSASSSASPGYIDIADKIEEEIEALEAEFYKQIKERTSVIEKDLVEIVQEFRRQVDLKLDQRNYESRYNLGLAFLEQNLYEEAIAELELAAGDEKRAPDCWGLIGQCYVKKRNYPEARRCFEGAIALTPEESPERFALAYELASLYEMMGENEAALALYREVFEWNPKFRNAAKRVKILEKIVS